MRSQKTGNADSVPGRSWKRRKTAHKAAVTLSDEVPRFFPALMKATMTPPEGERHGNEQGSKRAA